MLSELFNDPACLSERINVVKAARNLAATLGYGGRTEKLRKRLGYFRCLVSPRPDGARDTEAHESRCVVGLIVGHWHDQVRDTRRQGLSRRADASVMDQRGRFR